MSDMPTTTPWIKATASDNGGGCVMLRRNGANVEVRDSKEGDSGSILSFNEREVLAFVDGLRKGEFAHLLND